MADHTALAATLEKASKALMDEHQQLVGERESIDARLREINPKVRKLQAAHDALLGIEPAPKVHRKRNGKVSTPAEELEALVSRPGLERARKFIAALPDDTFPQTALWRGDGAPLNASGAASLVARVLEAHGEIKLEGRDGNTVMWRRLHG